ncbi:9793_t:CDS:2, partial [Funneliformis geosporum]
QNASNVRKSSELNLSSLCFHIDMAKNNNQVINQKGLARQFACNQSTICHSLQRVKITYKEITPQATEQLRKKNKAKIEEFINITLPSLLQSKANIFFLDEGKHYTLIFLIQITNGEKVIHSKLIEGGMKSKDLHEFLADFNPPNNGRKNVLIMDNLSVHKATKSCQKLKLTTIEELLRNKNIEPIFLPPYTPELNPVERCFNIIRQYVESCQARNEEKLKSAIEEKIKFFQGEDMTKYLESSVRECLMKLASFPQIESADYSYQPKEVLQYLLLWIQFGCYNRP